MKSIEIPNLGVITLRLTESRWETDISTLIGEVDSYYTEVESIDMIGDEDKDKYESYLEYLIERTKLRATGVEDACREILIWFKELNRDLGYNAEYSIERISNTELYIVFASYLL